MNKICIEMDATHDNGDYFRFQNFQPGEYLLKNKAYVYWNYQYIPGLIRIENLDKCFDAILFYFDNLQNTIIRIYEEHDGKISARSYKIEKCTLDEEYINIQLKS